MDFDFNVFDLYKDRVLCTVSTVFIHLTLTLTRTLFHRELCSIAEALLVYFESSAALNAGWFDQSSRLEYEFCEKMNNDLIAMGEAPWVEVPPCKDAHAINEWVPVALESEMPMLQTLLESLDGVAAKSNMPAVSLSADELLSPLENSWQRRIHAAVKPIPHYMGSFGPQAYCTDHLDSSTSEAIGNRSHSWHDLRKLNDQLAASTCYTMFDTFHGGCGGSVAAIQAGIFVQAGSDSEAEEVQQFESLTGRISLGDVRLVQPDRLPYFPPHDPHKTGLNLLVR